MKMIAICTVVMVLVLLPLPTSHMFGAAAAPGVGAAEEKIWQLERAY